MYYIKKYADCWAIHNDDTGASRKLLVAEVLEVVKEFPSLEEPKVCAVYADDFDCIDNKP